MHFETDKDRMTEQLKYWYTTSSRKWLLHIKDFSWVKTFEVRVEWRGNNYADCAILWINPEEYIVFILVASHFVVHTNDMAFSNKHKRLVKILEYVPIIDDENNNQSEPL